MIRKFSPPFKVHVSLKSVQETRAY